MPRGSGPAIQPVRRRCTRRTPAEILLILRGFAQGVSSARLARELGVSRGHLLDLRHQVQARVATAADAAGPLPDDYAEADEVYQNAGEKKGCRIATRSTGRGVGVTRRRGTAPGTTTARR